MKEWAHVVFFKKSNFLIVSVTEIAVCLKWSDACFSRTRELLELGLDNEDSEHENDDDTNQS